jgi:pseudouridine-5'-phosphate glycosidase
LLAPVLDFEKHSASENYIDTLPPETQQAIKEKKAIAGMDQEAVIMALGRPLRKTRETKDEVEQETWQFGEPPGRIILVTFAGSKVIRVYDTYAQMGGSVAQIPSPDH